MLGYTVRLAHMRTNELTGWQSSTPRTTDATKAEYKISIQSTYICNHVYMASYKKADCTHNAKQQMTAK